MSVRNDPAAPARRWLPGGAVLRSASALWNDVARRGFIWREERVFLLLAVIIGLFSGMLVVLFRLAIESTRLALLGSAMTPDWPRIILVPVVVGLAIGFLVVRFFPRVRGSGVNQTKAALYIYDGYIPFNTVVGKFLTCSLSIGSGQSLGPEDPSLQIGAGFASALGRILRLSRDKVRLIAPIGAAAGLAAAFNSPITAVLFVIEEVIGRWSAGVLGAIVLSAVSSAVVQRWFLGDEPLFRIPVYRMQHPGELLTYAAVGIIGGLASLLFVKTIVKVRPLLKAFPAWTQYLQPAIAGLLIGVIALRFPQVMGAGYEVIDQAMHGQYTWRILVLIALAKILATSISFVAGVPGGLFAPTLFMGAMIGAAAGGVQALLFPQFPAQVGAYALVGMGAMFAGNLRAPMTSVFMILEVSGNYSIILPVMIANTLAYLIVRRYQHAATFDVLARQDGMDLPSMEEQREEITLRVENAMRWTPGPVLRSGDTIHFALERIASTQLNYFLVNRGAGSWGVVSREDLQRQADDGRGGMALRSILSQTPVPLLHRDHPLDWALRQLGDWPILPVVHRADLDRLEGVLSLADVLNAYREMRLQMQANAE